MLLSAMLGACATLSQEGAGVLVFNAPLNAPAAKRTMPAGCRLVSSQRPFDMPELDLYGQRDPFRAERRAAGAAGANAMLVLTEMRISRHDSECPGSSPITDCPPSLGAWYRVALETYACTPEALRGLESAQSDLATGAAAGPD
jgi:hypothetical protein